MKILREHLCRLQVNNTWSEEVRMLVDDLLITIDYHRPLGPNGKHGDRHTPTCGCEDK